MPGCSFCYSMVYWIMVSGFSRMNLHFLLYCQLSVWRISISLIKWNIRTLAHILALHILYVMQHQSLHIKASLRDCKERSPLRKRVSNFTLLSFHWTCPHATFVFKTEDSKSKWATELVIRALIPTWAFTKPRLLSGNISRSQTSFGKVKKMSIQMTK